jgi:hypothetical protein
VNEVWYDVMTEVWYTLWCGEVLWYGVLGYGVV